jgi:hypothetical protein
VRAACAKEVYSPGNRGRGRRRLAKGMRLTVTGSCHDPLPQTSTRLEAEVQYGANVWGSAGMPVHPHAPVNRVVRASHFPPKAVPVYTSLVHPTGRPERRPAVVSVNFSLRISVKLQSHHTRTSYSKVSSVVAIFQWLIMAGSNHSNST